jgi:hypothetical protein
VKPLHLRTEYYLRDYWGDGHWVRRSGSFSLKDARAEAEQLAKRIGKGGRVQIVRVVTEVLEEVKP